MCIIFSPKIGPNSPISCSCDCRGPMQLQDNFWWEVAWNEPLCTHIAVLMQIRPPTQWKGVLKGGSYLKGSSKQWNVLHDMKCFTWDYFGVENGCVCIMRMLQPSNSFFCNSFVSKCTNLDWWNQLPRYPPRSQDSLRKTQEEIQVCLKLLVWSSSTFFSP